MKVMVIVGSTGAQSVTRAALRAAAGSMEKNGAQLVWVDVRDFRLPIFDPDAEEPPAVSALRRSMAEADAFLVGSPEYHGTLSGALKNLLDYTGSAEFRDKPVALVAAAGGARGGINTLNTMRQLFRSLRAHVVPEQVALTADDLAADGVPTRAVGARLAEMTESLLDYAVMLKKRRCRHFSLKAC